MGENREYLTQSASDGSINISEDVVVAIASEAIGEIEGVGAMMTTMTEQLTEQFMGKKPARGIRMDIQDGEITLDVYLTVKYGFAIPETAAKVQDAVMSAVETMTGAGGHDRLPGEGGQRPCGRHQLQLTRKRKGRNVYGSQYCKRDCRASGV